MLEIELDGKKVEVLEGSMVMHAADKAGTYVPHFCYHKKLSIAANCRMCLVDVEKAPKPMPACATPVTQGMIVRTKSDKALKAQQGVMEFLLINHPLDCPICDQGGECQLQDLAVGYGGSASRYTEEKRVVFHKDVGPLLSMEEMTRCIQCTRCVRFGQEIGGQMELGMIHRGEHSEITTFVGNAVTSELSGNMIDICPVGAITSKPFRYSARTWELSRRKSISPHDSTGANLIVQVKANRVMRVLPLENEDVNECWLADRDRFSYEAANSDDRLTTPMIKQNGQWSSVDWNTALNYIAGGLKSIGGEHGAASIGALASPHSTVEELHLLSKLVRGLGSENIDYRTRHCDFSNVGEGSASGSGVRWLGTTIASLSNLDAVFVIGSFLRKDHPLFAQRIRQAARKGAQVHALGAVADDWLMTMSSRINAAPDDWVRLLAAIAGAVGKSKGTEAPAKPITPLDDATLELAAGIAESLLSGERKAILLGNSAAQHPQAAQLLVLAKWIGEQTGATVGYLTEAANTVGAQLVRAMPGAGGLDAGAMIANPLKAYLLLNLEPTLDMADPVATVAALGKAHLVIAMTPFKSAAADVADVLLPITPFTETSGTFVSAEGRVQSFHGVVKAQGDSRPGWKVLRVLGNLLGLQGFEFETSEDVRAQALGDMSTIGARLDNAAPSTASHATPAQATAEGVFQRIADIGIYSSDPFVRRATSLQLTPDASPPVASVSAAVFERMGFEVGGTARFRAHGEGSGSAGITLPVRVDASLPDNVIRVPAGHPATVALGPMFGSLQIEKA
ncbi:NADH-quinone oxidoreductase subunit NuoG [soil metagenome]